MGLHLCYELALPRDTSPTTVAERVHLLHEKATQLAFEKVTSLLRVSAGDTLGAGVHVFNCSLEDFFRLCAHIRLGKSEHPQQTDALPDAIGFAVHPGRGCEGATFGLAWVPPEDEDARPIFGEPYVWHWYAACKTQYASVVSDEHLVHCHTTLVTLLEEAIALGFDVTVRDETHYWETRDPNRLIAEAREMNRIVAQIAGAFHDAVGDEARAEGAIFQHPEFERLESERKKEP